MENPIKMDDLGGKKPYFLETRIWQTKKQLFILTKEELSRQNPSQVLEPEIDLFDHGRQYERHHLLWTT